MLAHSLSRHDSLADENVHQTLQWLHILFWQEIVVHRNCDKMHEAAVELQMPVDVPEWMVPMAVVQVSVAAEHLLDDRFDVLVVIGREARSFANPIVVSARESAHRLIEVGWTSTDRSLGARDIAGVVGARVCGG